VAEGEGPEFKPQYHRKKKKDASFNTQQIIFFYIVIFSFCFWYQPLFPEYVLIVGLTFRISIPFRNPHAGVEK
jgi:hypothetical protein